jgi:hypothetical protein
VSMGASGSRARHATQLAAALNLRCLTTQADGMVFDYCDEHRLSSAQAA